MTYKTGNIYGIKGESAHRTAAAALTVRDKREGVGWVTTDSEGGHWEWLRTGPAKADRRAVRI
jgi:hypothetical protein